jgi:hypothetical protein
MICNDISRHRAKTKGSRCIGNHKRRGSKPDFERIWKSGGVNQLRSVRHTWAERATLNARATRPNERAV